MATFRNKAKRLALIWALDAKITGRGDAVQNVRRVLLGIAAGALQASYMQIPELVSVLNFTPPVDKHTFEHVQ